MSKLTTHQIRAMCASIEATINSHEARPGTARNVAALNRSQARLDSYRAELAEREAAERAQDAEQNTSQAAPVCGNCEGTGSVLLASGSIGCAGCAGTGRTQLEPRAPVPPDDPLPTVHTPPPHHRVSPTPITPAPPIRTATDDELRSICTSLLKRWTLGALLDQLWESEAKLSGTLTQPRQARAKRGA
jgi:hypothetical protein